MTDIGLPPNFGLYALVFLAPMLLGFVGTLVAIVAALLGSSGGLGGRVMRYAAGPFACFASGCLFGWIFMVTEGSEDIVFLLSFAEIAMGIAITVFMLRGRFRR